MDLTVREAATALGVTARTIRSRAEAGKIAAKKRDGRWVIDGAQLALTAAQQRELRRRAQRMRDDVDAALPGAMARSPGDRVRSVLDLDAFRLLAELAPQLRAQAADVDTLLDSALGDLAEAVHVYHASHKRASADRARRSVARLVARLLCRSPEPPDESTTGWIQALEGQVLPAIGGYLKWIEAEEARGSRGRR